MKKSITIKYDDFPEVKELDHHEILNIINAGKKVNAATIARYLKISPDSAERRLKTLELKGLCLSKITTIEDSLGRLNKGRIYYKK